MTRFVQLTGLGKPVKKLTSTFNPSKLFPSSAIILIQTNDTFTNSKICMVTKNKKIENWKGMTVFPGGLTSLEADTKLADYCKTFYCSYVQKYNFTTDDILYRVNALRELFEETGILLCIPENSETLNTELNEYPIKASLPSNSISDFNIHSSIEWREKVLKDPMQFEILLRSIQCVPDILSMIPWARIQTSLRTQRRWDARFYMALIDDCVMDKYDMCCALGFEISSISWLPTTMEYYNEQQQQSLNEKSDAITNEFHHRFPPPTIVKLNELHSICAIDNNLYSEWKNGYFQRKVCAMCPKICLKIETNEIMILWSRDYMYSLLDDENEVLGNEEYEKNGEYHQRFTRKMDGSSTWKWNSSFTRMCEYEQSKTQNSVSSKL